MTELVSIGTRTATSRGFDPGTRMLSFVAATETPCPALREDGGKLITVSEILVASGCVNVATCRGPILDTHDRDSLAKVLGKIRSMSVDGATIVGTALMSDREDVVAAVYPDLRDGIIDHVSAGYSCLKEVWDRSKMPIEVRVTEWSLDEVSLVPIPADESADIRARRAAAQPTIRTEANMTPDAIEAALKALGDSFTAGLAGLRTALTPPTVAVTEAPAVEVNPGERAAPTTAKPAAPAPATGTYVDDDGFVHAPAGDQAQSRGKREDGMDDDGDDDGTGGDAEERAAKRAKLVKNLDAVLGSRAAPEYRAAVEARLPSRLVRSLAVKAMGTPGRRETLKPSEAETARQSQGTRTQSFVSFGQRGGIGQSAAK